MKFAKLLLLPLSLLSLASCNSSNSFLTYGEKYYNETTVEVALGTEDYYEFYENYLIFNSDGTGNGLYRSKSATGTAITSYTFTFDYEFTSSGTLLFHEQAKNRTYNDEHTGTGSSDGYSTREYIASPKCLKYEYVSTYGSAHTYYYLASYLNSWNIGVTFD